MSERFRGLLIDGAGLPYPKSSPSPINLPSLKVTNAQWLIGSISFLRDESGTRADITLMPAEVFLPEPIILQPYASDVYQAVNGGAAAADGVAAETQAFQQSFLAGGAQ